MNKSLTSINNDVIFTGSLWIIWSLTWILLLTLAYTTNPEYDIIDFFNGRVNSDKNNIKFFWISIIIILIFIVSIISAIFFIIKTVTLIKSVKLYNLTDSSLLILYFLATFFLYFGIVFFILYQEKIRNVKSAINIYDNSQLNKYLEKKDLSSVHLDDNVVEYVNKNPFNKGNQNNKYIKKPSINPTNRLSSGITTSRNTPLSKSQNLNEKSNQGIK